MHSRPTLLAPLLALLLLGPSVFPAASSTPGTAEAAAPTLATEPPRLWLKCAVFDPVEGPLALAPELRLGQSQGYYIVQFDGPVSADRAEWLGTVSQVLAYIPDYAFAVRASDEKALFAHPGVRYVGLFEPAYKVEPRLSYSAETVDLAVLCFDRLDYPAVVGRLLELGATIVRVDPLMIQARAPGALALAIAHIPEVQWVEKYNPPVLANNAAAKILRIRPSNDGGYNFSTTGSLWSFNATSGQYEGYAGRNFTAAVVDTGVDGGHPAFAGKKVAYYAYGYSDWVDYDGHGTHTSGSVLGNGAYRASNPGTPGRYAGMAPLAGLVGQIMANAGYYTWCHDAYVSGAVVQSNSWGGGYSGTYDYSAISYDSAVRDSDAVQSGNQSLSVCFSAGNLGGYGAGSVVPPSTAKNVISVGATDDSSGTSVAGFSSRGPCDDGRIKPDLMAPGVSVTSCAANSGTSYVQASGTSMSCPIAAGACVVVNEYWNRTRGVLPSPALVKNLLINGAATIPGQTYPGNTQGWGRIDLANALLNNTNRKVWAEDQVFGLLTGVARTYLVNVTKAAEMRVSLVWTDFCGTANAAKALVNDLDLLVTLPNGTTYQGNVFTNGYSSPNGTADSLNNIEMVRFQSAQPGKWRIDVRGRNIPRALQDYTLVVGGPFDRVEVAHVDLAAINLTVEPADPAEGDLVTISAEIGNVGDLNISLPRWRLTVLGEDNRTTVLAASNFTLLGPGERRTVQAAWTAVRGLTEFAAEADPLRAVPEDNETNNLALLGLLVRGYGVGLSCDAPEVTVKPAATGTLAVTVRNLGNTGDTFALAVEGALPAGWAASVDGATPGVESNGTVTVNISVTPAAEALFGDRADFRLRATSSGNATYTKTVSLSALADQYFDFRLGGNASLWVRPGGTATHSIYLDNAGNGPETVELTMYGLPEGWAAFLSGGLFQMQGRERQRATLTVMPPAGAPALATSNITVEAAAGQNQRRYVYLATTVLQLAGVGLELADGPDAVPAGATAALTVKVLNTGNGPDAIILNAKGDDGWLFELPDGSPTVRAADFSLEDLLVTVPADAAAGEHFFMVTATSSVDGSVTSEQELSLYVEQRYSVGLSADETSVTIETGNSTKFPLSIQNTGNGDDVFSLKVEAPGARSWKATVTPSSIVLPPGGSAALLLRLRPPSDVTEGNYTFTLKATSVGDPSATASVRFSVMVVAPPAPPPPPPPPPPPVPVPEPEVEPARNRYVAWVQDHWQLSILLLVAIIGLSAGGAYAAVRRRKGREAPAAAGAPAEIAVVMAPSAYAASPAPPAPAPAAMPPVQPGPEPKTAHPPSPAHSMPAPADEPMETVDMGPPEIQGPEPASPVETPPAPQMPLADRRSDGPSKTSKRAVENDIDEILARLTEVTGK